MIISSLQNPKVKYTFKLRNRRFREKEKITIIEGYRELKRAFEYGMQLKECFYCPPMYLGENENDLIQTLSNNNVSVFEVNESVLRKLAYRDRPEGLIATVSTLEHSLDKIPIKPNGLYLIVESIEKPGNLGAILRSADATAVDGVIICDKKTDLYNPNVIRASTGALFSVPIAETNLSELKEWLNKNSINALAATPHTDKMFTTIDMTKSIAILVGTEQYGLSDALLEFANVNIKIPMLGKIDSLNVATAATILLYEAVRQRNL